MCDWMGNMMGSGLMWVGMLIAWMIGIALIVALVAASVYLFRRAGGGRGA